MPETASLTHSEIVKVSHDLLLVLRRESLRVEGVGIWEELLVVVDGPQRNEDRGPGRDLVSHDVPALLGHPPVLQWDRRVDAEGLIKDLGKVRVLLIVRGA